MPDDRINELEAKISFLERHIEEQDRVVLNLQNRVDSLGKDIKKFGEIANGLKEGSGVAEADERPPHY